MLSNCDSNTQNNQRKTPETRGEQLFQEFQEAHNVQGIEGVLTRSRAYNNLGAYYAEQEKYEDAINCYKQSMRIGGETAEAYLGLANIQYLQEDYTRAVHLTKKSLAINPEYEPAKEFLKKAEDKKKKMIRTPKNSSSTSQ